MSKDHGGRAHSKFSASGAERWFECPGSVKASEGVPDKPTEWSLEGTQAHEILEGFLIDAIKHNYNTVRERIRQKALQSNPAKMVNIVEESANFILGMYAKLPDAEIEVENRVYLDFIHPEMFGTYDSVIADYFDTLNVFDFKYGAGHYVSPDMNLQMIFYGIGVAHKHNWNFKKIRLWIIQPRIKGYNGPAFWDISVKDLKRYVQLFRDAVDKVENNPDLFVEGSWCHWCKGKVNCPLKQEARAKKVKEVFKPITDSQLENEFNNKKGITNGKENEEDFKKEVGIKKVKGFSYAKKDVKKVFSKIEEGEYEEESFSKEVKRKGRKKAEADFY